MNQILLLHNSDARTGRKINSITVMIKTDIDIYIIDNRKVQLAESRLKIMFVFCLGKASGSEYEKSPSLVVELCNFVLWLSMC